MNGRVQPRLMLGFLLILLVILALGSANMGPYRSHFARYGTPPPMMPCGTFG